MEDSTQLNHLLAGAISAKVIEKVLSTLRSDTAIDESVCSELRLKWIQNLVETYPSVPLPETTKSLLKPKPLHHNSKVILSLPLSEGKYTGAKLPPRRMMRPSIPEETQNKSLLGLPVVERIVLRNVGQWKSLSSFRITLLFTGKF